ncbi:unnamed protein product [Ectocarpus sp. 8 AP-2014]
MLPINQQQPISGSSGIITATNIAKKRSADGATVGEQHQQHAGHLPRGMSQQQPVEKRAELFRPHLYVVAHVDGREREQKQNKKKLLFSSRNPSTKDTCVEEEETPTID